MLTQAAVHLRGGVGVRRALYPAFVIATSDGLGRLGAVRTVGATHERVASGGGLDSTMLPQFKALAQRHRDIERHNGLVMPESAKKLLESPP